MKHETSNKPTDQLSQIPIVLTHCQSDSHTSLNTRNRQLPGSGRVITAGYPDPVAGEIPYPSHLYLNMNLM